MESLLAQELGTTEHCHQTWFPWYMHRESSELWDLLAGWRPPNFLVYLMDPFYTWGSLGCAFFFISFSSSAFLLSPFFYLSIFFPFSLSPPPSLFFLELCGVLVGLVLIWMFFVLASIVVVLRRHQYHLMKVSLLHLVIAIWVILWLLHLYFLLMFCMLTH